MLIYLHGFNSAPTSRKARRLQAWMQERGLGAGFACPALPHRPALAVRAIEAEIARAGAGPVTLIGSSLGGYYATWFAETRGLRAVLVNPAILPHAGLESFLGPQRNLYTGEEYEFTRTHLDELRALECAAIDPERYLVLLETGDEVLDWRRAARRYEGARMSVREGGDHSLQSFDEHLPRILRFAGLAGT